MPQRATANDRLVHLPVTPPNPTSALHVAGSNSQHQRGLDRLEHERLPAGAIKVTYDIKSVSRQRQQASR